MTSIATWWMWAGFLSFIFLMIGIDLFVFNKESHRVSIREATSWVIVWVVCALIFNLLLWFYLKNHYGNDLANTKALEFLTGYIIEQSLSVDNMFVFIMIFNHFAVPQQYQQRVLLYGVLSAIVMRFFMIVGGTWLVNQIHWVIYIFGAFLLLTGIRMLFPEDRNKDLSKNILLRWIRKHIRLTEHYDKEHFFIKKNQLWYATPLFVVLIMIEVSDLIFALDSIPAIFAITQDNFIIFTSNVFAILGLRALYFMLSHMADRFYLLKYGVGILLAFIGTKMLLSIWFVIPIFVALSVVVTILVTTVILSLLLRKRNI